mgnify:CR=1 FL=1
MLSYKKDVIESGGFMIDSINKAFGMSFRMEKIEKIKGLPIYMSSKRLFYKVMDNENSFLLVKLSDSEKFGVVAFEKQQKQYEEKINLPVAYWFDNVTRAQRDALINHHIPFVADDKQLYLPFLGISIQNSFKKKKEVKIEKMMPVTQSLFLFLVYKCKNKKIMKKEAAEYLNVTRTSITRASEQLEKMGLIRQEMSGKECYMWTEESGYQLFLKAKGYLINPIQESFVIENLYQFEEMPLSGECALSKYSMMNPSRVESVAIDKSMAKEYSFEKLDERWEDTKELIRIELWKYNPMRFSKDRLVDPISLYMSLLDNGDERIEGAIDEMLEEYEW